MRRLAAILLAAGLCAPAAAQQVPDPLSKTPPAALTDSKTGGITADAAALAAASSTAYTAQQIYQMTTPVAVSTYDAVRGIAVSTPGTTTTGVNGLAGYVVGNMALGDGGTTASPVALFGTGIANANGAYVWGINTLLTDNTSQVVSAGTGRQLWNELDFNVTSPNTTVRGLVLTGASIAQPALGIAVEVRPLGAASHWTAAFISQDGAAVNGLTLGIQGVAGALSSPSQFMLLRWSGADGTVYNNLLRATSDGALTLATTGAPPSGSFNLPAGARYMVNGVAGVNCSGVPTVSHATVGGITTVC